MFYKTYVDGHHFETERQALGLLRTHAPGSFRFVDRLADCADDLTLVFPRFLMDTSQAALQSAHPGRIAEAVCQQLADEIQVMKTLPLQCLPLRAATCWLFLERVSPQLGPEEQEVLQALPETSAESLVFRYDPQLDNFLVQDREAAQGVFSHDFSLWRRMHLAYPFAFLWHDLLERPRPKTLHQQMEQQLFEFVQTWCPAKTVTQRTMWLLMNRAEALAHEVDGHARRGHIEMSSRKLQALKHTLRELRACL